MRFVPQWEGVAIALTVFTFIFTIPSIRSLAKGSWRIKNPNYGEVLYEDEDGVASKESTDQFSNKRQFIVAFAVTLTGLGLSIADAILTIIHQKTHSTFSDHGLACIFLLFPAWVSVPISNREERRLMTLHTDLNAIVSSAVTVN